MAVGHQSSGPVWALQASLDQHVLRLVAANFTLKVQALIISLKAWASGQFATGSGQRGWLSGAGVAPEPNREPR